MYDSTPYRQTALETARRFRRAKNVLDAVQGQQPPGYSPGIQPPGNARVTGRGPQPPQTPTPENQGTSPYAPSSPIGLPPANKMPTQGDYGTGMPTPPPGAVPGTQEYWDWYSSTFNQDQFSPGGIMSEILSLGEMVGGFYDPMSVFGNTPANMWDVGKSAMDFGTNTLGGYGLAPGTAPTVHNPGIERVPLNWNTVNYGVSLGRDLGHEAAGYIPDQGVRGISDVTNEILNATPGAASTLGAADAVSKQIQADAEAGYGLMGIPMSQVENMQAQNIAEVNLAQEEALRQLGIDASANGTYGQGNYDAAVASQFGNEYAPARIKAIQDPLEMSYKLGPDVLNAATGAVSKIGVPISELGTKVNLEDLQRQLQGGIARSDVFGRLAGQGLNVGGDLAASEQRVGQGAATDAAQLDLQSQGMNLESWLKQFGTMAPIAYGAPWKGYDAVRGAGNDRNQLTLDLIRQAMGESDKLRQLHTDRKAQELQESLGLFGGVAGGLGQFVGGGGLGDFAGGLRGTGGGGSGAGFLGALTGDIGAGIGDGISGLLGFLGL